MIAPVAVVEVVAACGVSQNEYVEGKVAVVRRRDDDECGRYRLDAQPCQRDYR